MLVIVILNDYRGDTIQFDAYMDGQDLVKVSFSAPFDQDTAWSNIADTLGLTIWPETEPVTHKPWAMYTCSGVLIQDIADLITHPVVLVYKAGSKNSFAPYIYYIMQ